MTAGSRVVRCALAGMALALSAPASATRCTSHLPRDIIGNSEVVYPIVLLEVSARPGINPGLWPSVHDTWYRETDLLVYGDYRGSTLTGVTVSLTPTDDFRVVGGGSYVAAARPASAMIGPWALLSLAACWCPPLDAPEPVQVEDVHLFPGEYHAHLEGWNHRDPVFVDATLTVLEDRLVVRLVFVDDQVVEATYKVGDPVY